MSGIMIEKREQGKETDGIVRRGRNIKSAFNENVENSVPKGRIVKCGGNY